MNPPAEQLLRDYLNRLAVAARDRLGSAARQALLERTRARIEVASGGLAGATAAQVRRALADLGDPVALVEGALVENESPSASARKGTAVGSRLARHGNGAVAQIWAAAADGNDPARESSAGAAAAAGQAAGRAPGGAGPAFDLQVPGSLPATGGAEAPAAVSVAAVPVAAVAEVPGAVPVAEVPEVPAADMPVAGVSAARVPAGLPRRVPGQTSARAPWLPGGTSRSGGVPNGNSAGTTGAGEDGAGPSGTPVHGAGRNGAAPGGLASGPGLPDSGRYGAAPGQPGVTPGSNGIARGAPHPRQAPEPESLAAAPAPASEPEQPGSIPGSGPAGSPAGSAAGSSGGSPAGGAGRPPRRSRAPLPPSRPRRTARSTSDTPAALGTPPASAGRAADSPPGGDSSAGFTISAVEPVDGDAEPGLLAALGAAGWSRLARFGTAVRTVAARDRMEIVILLLLGVGGAIYPPIWVIGALFTLVSRKWDHRDKWLGLALPIVLVLFGAVLIVMLGGERTSIGAYATEAWLAVGRLSRVGAVIGAVFLLQRLHKYEGRREPRRPPWGPPRRRTG